MILDVRIVELLPNPVDAVWGALTDAVSISEWLMATDDFRPEVGTRFRMKTGTLSASGWVEAEVLELDPPHRMVWAWSVAGGAAPTSVTFELVAEGGGTRLTLTHVGEIDPAIGAQLEAGWPGRVELLRRSLD